MFGVTPICNLYNEQNRYPPVSKCQIAFHVSEQGFLKTPVKTA